MRRIPGPISSGAIALCQDKGSREVAKSSHVCSVLWKMVSTQEIVAMHVLSPHPLLTRIRG